MIAEVTKNMENVLGTSPLNVSPELAEKIDRAEVEAYLSGAFSEQQADHHFLVRDFYERLVVLLVEARNFEALPQKFTLLSRLYEHQLSQNSPSLYEAKLTSLHLLYLYTCQNHEEFQTKLIGLKPLIANSAEVKTIVEFVQLIDLGNYQRAFDVIQTLSPSHQVLLSRLLDQRRYQTCKMVEYSNPDLRVGDLAKMLDLRDEADFTRAIAMIDALYQKGEISWRVVDGNHIEKREKASSSFNADKVIKDTISLIRDFEKII